MFCSAAVQLLRQAHCQNRYDWHCTQTSQRTATRRHIRSEQRYRNSVAVGGFDADTLCSSFRRCGKSLFGQIAENGPGHRQTATRHQCLDRRLASCRRLSVNDSARGDRHYRRITSRSFLCFSELTAAAATRCIARPTSPDHRAACN